MKKTYQVPSIKCVNLKIRPIMQTVSGLQGFKGYGGGATGRSADARRSSFSDWDEDE